MSDDALIFESERFGFTVGYDRGMIRVALPHHCDDWEITWASRYGLGLPPVDALEALAAFIAEAEQARGALLGFMEGGLG